jgi:uncharacterized protein YndB with AHSA1/START domain
MYSMQVSRHMKAQPAEVYRALLDAAAIAQWRAPDGMACYVHEFDAREGGSFRVSLTYDAPESVGKSSERVDTYHGHFAKLVENEQVVEVLAFETAAPEFRGEMTLTTTLVEKDGGTEVLIVHEGVPDAISPADNETGTRMALAKLAALVEAA